MKLIRQINRKILNIVHFLTTTSYYLDKQEKEKYPICNQNQMSLGNEVQKMKKLSKNLRILDVCIADIELTLK